MLTQLEKKRGQASSCTHAALLLVLLLFVLLGEERTKPRLSRPDPNSLEKMARSSSTSRRLLLVVVAALAAVATLAPTAALAAPSPADNAVFTNYIIPNDVDGKPVSM